MAIQGSVHVHGIGKIWNAPTIDWNQMKENETIMNNAIQIIQYIDSIINAAIPENIRAKKVKTK